MGLELDYRLPFLVILVVCLKGSLYQLGMMLGLGKFWLVPHQHQRSQNCDLQENTPGLGQAKSVQVYFQARIGSTHWKIITGQEQLVPEYQDLVGYWWVSFGLGSSFMDLSGNLLLVSLITWPEVGVTCRLKRGTVAQA